MRARIRTSSWWATRLGGGAGILALLSGPAMPDFDAGAIHDGTRDCETCHVFERSLSHPVDLVPSMDTPGHLPLQRGRVTCVTCHDLESSRSSLLRAEPGSDLCGQCHTPDRGRISDLHALGSLPAHLQRADDRPASADGLDAESEACLSCHDGTLAPGDPVRSGSATMSLAARLLGGQHPIGIEQRPRGTGDTLASPAQIDPAVRLFDGRVGCGSCHSPYARHESLLVMSNDRSGLCLACHRF